MVSIIKSLEPSLCLESMYVCVPQSPCGRTGLLSVFLFVCFKKKAFIYFERERVCACEQERGREREQKSQAGSMLSVPSPMRGSRAHEP